MSRRPGGELSNRPLHFIWIADCSGSMSVDGKIQALNNAIKDALPFMQQVADDNPHAKVLVRALKFSHGAEWHIANPTEVHDFRWRDLIADPLQKGTVNTDIIFLLDTSGSMSDEIQSVKKSCVDFADHIIQQGANVRLGLIGFDIGGHRGHRGDALSYTVHTLSRYTIGIWPLSQPDRFKTNVQSLRLGLFGGAGCYLANSDTTDIFPHVVQAFDGPPDHLRILVIISDEIGSTDGLPQIVNLLNQASIKAHVLGVSGHSGAHQQIAEMTGGQFWDITRSKGVHSFDSILEVVADAIAKEVTQRMADGTVSAGTDLGTGLRLVAEQLRMPPMEEQGLPPVLVLISDGLPTDNFEGGLQALMSQPWGRRAVRIAIGIGHDADESILQAFIGHDEIRPLQANNSESLIRYIRWASTMVLKSASTPASGGALSLPAPPPEVPSDVGDVW